VDQKSGQTLTDLKKIFTGRFLGKFAVKWILKIPPHLAYVVTLPCETLLSAKQAINDKLQSQGSMATYLRCGDVFNNQLKKGCIAESLSKTFLKSVNIWQSFKQERNCLNFFSRDFMAQILFPLDIHKER